MPARFGFGLRRARLIGVEPLSGEGSTFPLDLLSASLAGAWSVARALSRRMIGLPIVRLRRTLDNMEQDFEPNALGLLDETAVLNWATGGSVFIVTEYDNTGNNRHRTQTIATNQAILVENGVLQKRGGRPAAVAANVGTNLQFYYDANGLTSATIQGVMNIVGPAGLSAVGLGANGSLFGFGQSGGSWGNLGAVPQLGGLAWRFGIGVASNPTWARPITAGQTIRIAVVKNGTAETPYLNGQAGPVYTAPAGATANIATTGLSFMGLGGQAVPGNAISETYFGPGTALSAADLAILDQDQARFYV